MVGGLCASKPEGRHLTTHKCSLGVFSSQRLTDEFHLSS